MYLPLLCVLLCALLCSGEDEEAEDRAREMRIEEIRQQILTILPPSLLGAAVAHSEPSEESRQAVQLLLTDTEEEEGNPKREKLVVPAQGDATECLSTNTSQCQMFRYEFGPSLNLSSVDLWVSKEDNATLGLSVNLTLSAYPDEDPRYLGSFHFELQDKGWKKLRLLHAISMPAHWNDTVHTFVEIFGVGLGPPRPYLLLSKPPLLSPPRHRREDCNASESCCQKRLRLSFSEIGFHFIVYPDALEAGMCVGKCRLDPSTLRTHYERALTTTIERNLTLRDSLGECWTLCCKPRLLKEVRVIYRDMDNLHHDQFIPELSVESCGCS